MLTLKVTWRPITRFTMLAAVLAALFIALPLAVAYSSAQPQTAPIAGETSDSLAIPAPEFDLAQILGHSMKSADLKENVVVVDLWATWRPPCIEEIPNYNTLYEKYKDKNVRIVGIVFDSGSVDEVKAKMGDLKVRYPILFGTDEILSAFGVTGFPATVVLTKDWTVHHSYLGLVPNKKELIEREIDALLSQDSLGR